MEEIIHKIQYLSQMKELIENKRNIYIYGAKSNAKDVYKRQAGDCGKKVYAYIINR